MEQDPVVHFELPYEDRDRAAKFYQSAFGWKPQMMGEEMGNYVVVQTTPTDEKGMTKAPGQINGGMYKRTTPDQAVGVVVSVKDINAAIERVKQAGGTIMGSGPSGSMEPAMIPGVGLFMSFKDPEGNRLSMIQPAR